MAEEVVRRKPGTASVKEMPVLQDGPPPGSFAPVRFARRIPNTGPRSVAIFLAAFWAFSYGMYQVGKGNKIRRCLAQFYHVTRHTLHPIKPLAKLISFMAIVFATWWQGVGIALLCSFGILPKEGKFQNALQDFLICIEMAIAAVAHIFVFSATPYHFIPASEYGEITSQRTETLVEVQEGNEVKPAFLAKTETKVEGPGTSVRESVQDIVVGGGQKAVKDVDLTINQVIEPAEKGVTKIQDTFHQISVSSNDSKEETEVKVEEHQKNVPSG